MTAHSKIHLPHNEAVCTECDGTGWAEPTEFNASDWMNAEKLVPCFECEGTGLVMALCGCEQPVDENGYCADCETYVSEDAARDHRAMLADQADMKAEAEADERACREYEKGDDA